MGIIASWAGAGLTAGTPVDNTTAGTGDTPLTTVTPDAVTIAASGLHSPRLQIDQAAATEAQLTWGTTVLGTLSTHAVRAYIELSALPPGNARLLAAHDAANVLQWWLDVTSAGILRLRDAVGGAIDTSAAALPTGTELRIEVVADGTGTVTASVYQGDDTTAWDVLSGTGVGTTVEQIRLGHPNGTTVWPTYWVDELAVADTAAEIGPVLIPEPQPRWPLRDRYELLLDGVWTDITGYVFERDPVTITRGRSAEADSADPCKMTLTLNNRDGRFSPRNPTSPYYGTLGRNTQIRASIPDENNPGGRLYRFYGEVASWPATWAMDGVDRYVKLTAAGVRRRLTQNAPTIRSPLYRSIAALDSIVSYWPMEDGTEATQVSSSDPSTAAMTISGSPQMAGYSDFTSSDPLPICETGRFSGAIGPYTPSGELLVRLFLFVDQAVTGETSLLRVEMAGTAWELTLVDDGDLRTLAYDSSGVELVNSRTNFLLNSLGFTTVDLQLQQSGSDIAWTTRVNDFVNTDTINSTFTYVYDSGTVTGQNLGAARTVTIGRDRGLGKVIVGHLLVSSIIDAVFNESGSTAIDYVYYGLVARNGENPSNRMARLCGEESIGFVAIDKGTSGNIVTLGDQGNRTLVDLLEEAADADIGILTETRDQLGFGYRTRLSLYNQAPATTLDYSAAQIMGDLVPVDDDRFTLNDLTVKREAGSSVRVEQTTGPLSTAEPPAGVGRYAGEVALSLEDDGQLADQAGWRLHLGTVDEARYPQLIVNLRASGITDTLYGQILALDIGDRIVLTGIPAGLPPDDVSLLVQGYAETLRLYEHEIAFNLSSESPWHVAQVETQGFDRLDTDASTLAAAATATATSLSVASSGALWTTDAADLPMDVMVSGERVTVTAVSGTTSPQTFTVTRSVNGVVKAQTAGAAVTIAEPVYVAL